MMHPVVLGRSIPGMKPSGTFWYHRLSMVNRSAAPAGARPLSLTATLAMLELLCSALQAAAERDLRTAHCIQAMCSSDGRRCFIRFWYGRAAGVGGAKRDGLLSYVAPESLETGLRRQPCARDVFSGVLSVYECLIGQPMFDAKSLASYLAMVGTPPKMTVKHPSYAHPRRSARDGGAGRSGRRGFATV